jgi:plasmid stabilization system protein ParE
MPRRKLSQRVAAKRDVDREVEYLREHAGNETANQFLDEFEHLMKRVIRFPHIGRPWPTRNPELEGLRRLVFRNLPYSLFYRSTETVFEVVRVLHHSRDIPALLEDL